MTPINPGKTALLVIDVQNDFTTAGESTVNGKKFTYPAGNLGCEGGYEIVPGINQFIQDNKDKMIVVASLDWHTSDNVSFASQHEGKAAFNTIDVPNPKGGTIKQMLWPDHCVQGTEGTKFLPGLNIEEFSAIVRKGDDKRVDSYSAFFDNAKVNKTKLDYILKMNGITDVICVGIATDFCVKCTAIDAQELGYKTTVLSDLCRATQKSAAPAALKALSDRGIRVVTSDELTAASK